MTGCDDCRRSRRRALGIVALAFIAGCGRQAGPASPSRIGEEAAPQVRRIQAPPGTVVSRACTASGPELCFDARDDNCNGIIDEGCGVQTGLVQFAIAWNDPTADVDLNVTDPKGELAEAGRPTTSGLVKERDCPGRRQECHGQNLENVYLESSKELVRGVYRVRIRLERLGDREPPIPVTFGARVGPKTYATEVEVTRPEQEVELMFEL